MATVIDRSAEDLEVQAPALSLSLSTHRLFAFIAIFAMVIGMGSFVGGIAGATYTYQQAVAENITTPNDAVFAEVPVRGPLSMWAQVDIITEHQLNRTEGLRWSEMPRMIPVLDDAGNPVIGEDGEPAMMPNAARDSWISAVALNSALNLGILAYMLSFFAIVVGLTLIALGWVVRRLDKATVTVS
jgi:hypothetical protein